MCAANFLQYSMDCKARRLTALNSHNQKIVNDTFQLQSKYFYIWINKCKINRKLQIQINSNESLNPDRSSNQIIESSSLEKKEISSNVLNIVEISNKNRPAPRKPSFLNDSVDKTLTINEPAIVYSFKHLNNHTAKINSMHIEENSSKILLPPTAFVSSKNTSYEIAFNSTNSTNNGKSAVSNTLPFYSSAMKNSKFETVKFIDENKQLTIKSTSSSSIQKEKEFKIQRPKVNSELIELKNRLEEFSEKCEKLK